ncbi:MAG: hypothetical protein M1812_007678 [Candelaria pacifica]|nr:MAG: hypothetical protein M1812_007678 [Candelaria pacifica]
MNCISNSLVKPFSQERISSRSNHASYTGRRPALIPHSTIRSLEDEEDSLRHQSGLSNVPPPDDPYIQSSISEAIREKQKGSKDRHSSRLQKQNPRYPKPPQKHHDISHQELLPQLGRWAHGHNRGISDQEQIMPWGPQLAVPYNKRKHRSPSEDAALQYPDDMSQDIPHMSEIESQDEELAEAPPMIFGCQCSNSTLGSQGRKRSPPRILTPHSVPINVDTFPLSSRKPSIIQIPVSPTDTSSL